MLGDGLAASVADVQDRNRIAFDGEKNAVHIRLASVKQVPYLKGNTAFSGASAQRWGEWASEATASRNP
jgi:hypothetical protein